MRISDWSSDVCASDLATSIDAIIERAGGSKRNIYNEFGNKEGLFAALVGTFAEKALSSLAVEEIEGRDLRETLLRFGHQLMTIYMSPALIGVYQIGRAAWRERGWKYV